MFSDLPSKTARACRRNIEGAEFYDAAMTPRPREQVVYHFLTLPRLDSADAGSLFLAAQASRHHHRRGGVRPRPPGPPSAGGGGGARRLGLARVNRRRR